ncbi:hypothetical protein SAY86_017399 [Trapa natans]|uniref:Uncharacterized protein n=1 Tax=Trapa natans TaxID=22666 RepID=A0AAN7LQ03_TRANT|nr:hypothetical protein SAY86_017399 [Trapa natans]
MHMLPLDISRRVIPIRFDKEPLRLGHLIPWSDVLGMSRPAPTSKLEDGARLPGKRIQEGINALTIGRATLGMNQVLNQFISLRKRTYLI